MWLSWTNFRASVWPTQCFHWEFRLIRHAESGWGEQEAHRETSPSGFLTWEDLTVNERHMLALPTPSSQCPLVIFGDFSFVFEAQASSTKGSLKSCFLHNLPIHLQQTQGKDILLLQLRLCPWWCLFFLSVRSTIFPTWYLVLPRLDVSSGWLLSLWDLSN